MDTEVSPTASVPSIVDSNDKTNVQYEVQHSLKGAEIYMESEHNESSGDKATQIITEPLNISAKAIELLEQTDLSEEPKPFSIENTSNENSIEVDQSERKGKN